MRHGLAGFAFVLSATVLAGPLFANAYREEAENPVYKSWSKFKSGTFVVYKSVTEIGSSLKLESTTTYKLVDLTANKATVEMTVAKIVDGKEVKNPPFKLENRRMFTLPPGVKKEEFGKPKGVTEQGEETIKVAGKEYRAKWHKATSKVEAGDTFTHTWSSDEVPGGLIKTVNRTPATKSQTTIELAEVKIPE